MKKRQVFGFVVAGLLAGFVSHAVAQSATAYSSTAVGVIKKTIPAGKSAFISFPLDSSSSANHFYETPLMNLPVGSSASMWDATENKWISSTRQARGGWGSFSNLVILDGQPIFVQNKGSSDFVAVFAGEVPSESSLSVAIPSAGNQTAANPYPTPFTFGTSALANNLSVGSSVSVYDMQTGWVKQTKQARGGWGSFASTNLVLAPGDGIWISVTGTSSNYWTVTKPYTWPE